MIQELGRAFLASCLAVALYVGFMLGLLGEQRHQKQQHDVEKALWHGVPMEHMRNFSVLVHRHNTT